MTVHPKYLVPNGMTALSMTLGLGSIANSIGGDAQLAAWMILWAVLADKLDGTVARLLKATSRFGTEFDSFSDFVAFGIAPATLIYVQLRPLATWQGAWRFVLMACCAAFVVAAAIRLARFNITQPLHGDKYFYGIPTPMSATIIAAFYLSAQNHTALAGWVTASPVYMVIAAGLMVSHVLLPKLRRRRNRLLNVFQTINVAAVYVVTPLRVLPEYLLGLALLYLLVGAIWTLTHGVQADPPVREQAG